MTGGDGPADAPDTPAVSVVVPSFGGPGVLERCLASLLPQCGDDVEVVAPSTLAPDDRARLAARHPSVRFLRGEVPEPTDFLLREIRVFRLRREGVLAARGRIVLLTEDHATVSPTWVADLRAAVEAEPGVIAGGPVGIGRDDRVRDWALYLCEYAALMPPMPDGEPGYLSGVNAAYRRDDLLSVASVWSDAFFENEVHDALLAAGHRYRLVPGAAIRSWLAMTPLGAAQHLYTGGRRFGRYRRAGTTAAKRWLWVAAVPIVPPLLLARIGRSVLGRQPAVLRWMLPALPLMACFLLAWTAGEAAGLVAGGRPAGTRAGAGPGHAAAGGPPE